MLRLGSDADTWEAFQSTHLKHNQIRSQMITDELVHWWCFSQSPTVQTKIDGTLPYSTPGDIVCWIR